MHLIKCNAKYMIIFGAKGTRLGLSQNAGGMIWAAAERVGFYSPFQILLEMRRHL